MAWYAETLRGDGLERVQRALDALEADPLGLDQARTRFSQPPPSYASYPSGTTTRPASPELLIDEQRRQEQELQAFRRREKLMKARGASRPLQQFRDQVVEEWRRIWNADPATSGMELPLPGNEPKEVIETIKGRWVKQGIWRDEWDEMAAGRGFMYDGKWKHEDPLELESEPGSPSPTFGLFAHRKPEPKPPKSDDEMRQIAERRAIRQREREASRPYNQFIYQISKEREKSQNESANDESADAADINTRAYENVKNIWVKRGIWNERWGTLPGMSWKHEWPLDEEAADDPAPVPTNLVVNDAHETGPGLFGTFPNVPPVFSDHRQTSGIMNATQQGPFADDDPAPVPANPFVHDTHNANQAPRPSPGPANPVVNGTYGPFFFGTFPNVPPVFSDHRQTSGTMNAIQQGPFADDDPAPVPVNPFVDSTHEAEEAPTVRLSGSSSPVFPNHHGTCDIMNGTQQEPFTEFGSARLENSDAEPSPSASNSPRRHTTGNGNHRPTAGQGLRSKRKVSSYKDEQPQPVASASLGPVHPSKVSKATRKKSTRSRQQLNTSQEAFSGDQPLLSGSDVAEVVPPAASIPPRRSKRLQPPESNTAKGPTGTTSPDSTKVFTRSRPMRNGAGKPKSIGSAKPQGVSKKQYSSRARGKARNDVN